MSEEKAPSLRTLQADVAALDPLDFPCDLLIASPPCTAFGPRRSRHDGTGSLPAVVSFGLPVGGSGQPVSRVPLHRERCPAPNGSSSVARSDRRV